MNDNDIKTVCNIINIYGDGEHPWADAKSFPYFKKNYILDVLNRAIGDIERITRSKIVQIEF